MKELQKKDAELIIDDIMNYLNDTKAIHESLTISLVTLNVVNAMTKKFNSTKELWYKDKKKTLAIVALLCMIAVLPGGIIFSPAIVGIKDSIANGTDPKVAILDAYKNLNVQIKELTKKQLIKISEFIKKIVVMPKAETKQQRKAQTLELYNICKDAKSEIFNSIEVNN